MYAHLLFVLFLYILSHLFFVFFILFLFLLFFLFVFERGNNVHEVRWVGMWGRSERNCKKRKNMNKIYGIKENQTKIIKIRCTTGYGKEKNACRALNHK